VALGQAEYTIGLWALRGTGFEAGLHVITFVDVGTAWDNSNDRWDVQRQRFRSDGGIGLGTSEDDIRVYVARDLSDPDAKFVWSLRLQRPF
jgi:outer membrane translocation and assembly module TamA